MHLPEQGHNSGRSTEEARYIYDMIIVCIYVLLLGSLP